MTAIPRAKIDTILKHLKRVNGVTIAALQKATGWKPHSIRAALTGLRKRGFHIERSKTANCVTAYRAIE